VGIPLNRFRLDLVDSSTKRVPVGYTVSYCNYDILVARIDRRGAISELCEGPVRRARVRIAPRTSLRVCPLLTWRARRAAASHVRRNHLVLCAPQGAPPFFSAIFFFFHPRDDGEDEGEDP
jgi:hypothetical protein